MRYVFKLIRDNKRPVRFRHARVLTLLQYGRHLEKVTLVRALWTRPNRFASVFLVASLVVKIPNPH